MKANIFLPLRLAFLELLNNRKFALSFVLNLSIGLFGFILVDAFRGSVDAQIKEKSKDVLGADLAIMARRMLTEEEQEISRKTLPQGHQSIEIIEMYSMAYSTDKSRLVNLIAVDEAYPLFPTLKLRDSGLITHQDTATLHDNGAWMVPELLVQMNLKVGEHFQIGETELKLTGIIEEDPSSSSNGFALAPKIYISKKALEKSGLLQHGSRLSHSILYLLPENHVALEEWAKTLNRVLTAQDIRVQTHETASRELNRALIMIGDNLSLISLIALFLAGIGASYLFKSHTQSQIKDMAILLTIGMPQSRLLLLSMGKIFFLSLASVLVIGFLSLFLLPLATQLLQIFDTAVVSMHLQPHTLFFAFIVAMFTSLLLCLPTLSLLSQVKPSVLLKESEWTETGSRFLRRSLLFIPAIIFFWGLSCWQSRSWIIGTAFSFAFIAAAILMYLIALVFLAMVKQRLRHSLFPQKLSWLNLIQLPSSTIIAFLAISLSALLLNVIPHLEATVKNELSYPEDQPPPSLFLFDIQEDQVEELTALAQKHGIEFQNISPMVRARLEKTNDQELQKAEESFTSRYEGSRESEQETRLRQRSYNLSYRQDLISSESLVAGKPFSGVYDWDNDSLPEISLEKRFADRLGIKIGDTMEFDIQGVNVKGLVVNTRKVKWSSFQPNFFVQFQPGVLDDAPKSFLASMTKLDFDKKISAQNIIVGRFPNISIVDVEQALERINSLMDQILKAVSIITLLAVLAGFAVIFSIMNHNAHMRLKDTNLYKILGVGTEDLKKITRLEIFILIWAACLTGVILSILMTSFLTHFILEEQASFAWRYSLLATVGMIVFGYLTGYMTISRALLRKPNLQI